MADKKEKDLFEKEAELVLQKRRRKHLKKYMKKRILIPAFIILFFVGLGTCMFINSLHYQSTDDAFIEGRMVSVSPKVAGQVTKLCVDDNDYVKEGQLLLEIDSRDYQNKVNELESALKEAKANKEVSINDIKRTKVRCCAVPVPGILYPRS